VTPYLSGDSADAPALKKTAEFVEALRSKTKHSQEGHGLVIVLTKMENCVKGTEAACVNAFADRIGVSAETIVPLKHFEIAGGQFDVGGEVSNTGSLDKKYGALLNRDATLSQEMKAVDNVFLHPESILRLVQAIHKESRGYYDRALQKTRIEKTRIEEETFHASYFGSLWKMLYDALTWLTFGILALLVLIFLFHIAKRLC
jgi:hypothetical protein